MTLAKIISMANVTTRLRFLAMERSLRATGCQLPLWVIPYDDRRFDLPQGSSWWEVDDIVRWLEVEAPHQHAKRVMRKYQCLTEANYQFVDADVIWLRNPEEVLSAVKGFVTSCGHWHNPSHTTTAESNEILRRRSTVWQARVFNSGQFACDQQLYSVSGLIQSASHSLHRTTCLEDPFHEQPGLNLLVFLSDVAVTNLTLPPYSMESTWAGDYDGTYKEYWKEQVRSPYLIHWAGVRMDLPRLIHELFARYLTPDERFEWNRAVKDFAARSKSNAGILTILRRLRRVWKAVGRELD